MTLSKPKRFLCRLWALPIYVATCLSLLFSLVLISEMTSFGLYNPPEYLVFFIFLGFFVLISFLIAYLITIAPEDRLIFRVSLTVFFAAIVVYFLAHNYLRYEDLPVLFLCVLDAACICAAAFVTYTQRDAYMERVERRFSTGGTTIPKAETPQRKLDTDVTLESILGTTSESIQPKTEAATPNTTAAEESARTTTASTKPQPVDANSCSATDLLVLPGMNAALARGIVSERDANGPYTSVQQLVERCALKPHVVAPFIKYLNVVPPAGPTDTSRRARLLDL